MHGLPSPRVEVGHQDCAWGSDRHFRAHGPPDVTDEHRAGHPDCMPFSVAVGGMHGHRSGTHIPSLWTAKDCAPHPPWVHMARRASVTDSLGGPPSHFGIARYPHMLRTTLSIVRHSNSCNTAQTGTRFSRSVTSRWRHHPCSALGYGTGPADAISQAIGGHHELCAASRAGTRPHAACDLTRNHVSKQHLFGNLLFKHAQQEIVMVQLQQIVARTDRSTWVGLLVDAAVAASCIACSISLVVWIA